MKRPVWICSIAASAFIVVSCEPPEIMITTKRVGARQLVTLTQDWGLIFSEKKDPCVDRIELSEHDAKGKLAWRIEATTGQCVNLASFTIGEAPAGFSESNPLPASLQGRYLLSVIGTGIGEAEVDLP
jgi:hypothetical protein